MYKHKNYSKMNVDVNKSSIEAAQEAIAKVNAILIAKGKLKPSQLSGDGPKNLGTQNRVITREVEINNVPIGCRNMLTRGATQEEISKLSGAAVATKGRYMTQDDKNRNPKERPLYLHVQGTTHDAVNLAVGRINEIIANGLARQGPRMSRFAARGPNPPPGPTRPPPPVMNMNPPNQNFGMPVIQEKLYIGLEHAPPNFSVKDKLFGPGGSFLQHIQSETGGKVSLRGKGSGFIEQNGLEAPEPMHVHIQHVNMMGLQQAKELSTNLIQTVQQEYAAFQQSFVTMPPPNLAIPQPAMLVPPPQMVSLAQPPPPLLPGQQMMTSIPPPQQMLQQHQPQANYLTPPPQVPVSLSAPGVVIPQLAGSNMSSGITSQPQGQILPQGQPIQTFMQPNNLGQQVPQFIQSSEQQIMGQLGNPQQVVVSVPAPGQQGGQVVYSTIQGPPIQHQVQQVQQQMMPAGTVQIHQPQPGQIIQQQAMPPPQQQQQHITVQQQLLPPPQQPAVISSSQPYLQPPMMQTSISQLPLVNPSIQQSPTLQSVSVNQQQLHQQQQPVSWVSSAPTYTSSTFTVIQQPNQNPEMIISTPQTQPPMLITSSAGSSPPTSAASSQPYVYKTGPSEEPKRRFTEEKQDEKVPEGLLGYEHGPPHLTNLMVQPGQPAPAQPAPPTNGTPQPGQQQQQQQQQLVYGQQVVAPPLPGELQSQQPGLMYGGQIVQQAPPPGVTQQPPHPPPQFPGIPQQQLQQPQQLFQQPQMPGQPGQPQMISQHQLQAQPGQPPLPGQPGQPQMLGQPGQHQMTGQPQLPPQPGQPPQTLPGQPPQSLQQVQQIQPPPAQTQLTQIHENVGAENEGQSPGQTVSPGPPPHGEDKILMPPPPNPNTGVGVKRPSPGLSPQGGTEPRKKSKGFHDEDDDVDVPSSIASQIKEMKKYSFNQYSSTPQLYTAPPTNTFSQYGGAAQNATLPPQDYQQQDMQHQQQQQEMNLQQQQQQQQQGLQQPPPPLPPPPQQYDTQNPASQYPGVCGVPTSVYGQSSTGPTFSQYNVVPSPAYSPISSIQPPPPPPPPQYDSQQGSGSPSIDNSDKVHGFNPPYLPAFTRDDNSFLQQPPPPPPPTSQRSTRFW